MASVLEEAQRHPSLPDFDYESKLWGAHEVRISPTYLGALRLHYCLEDLKGVRGRVLEVGCGGGGMVRALKSYRPDLEVLGCDLSRTATRVAGQRCNDVDFAVANAYHLPYASGSIAAYIMFDVLEHVDDPKQVLLEANRLLRPEGVLHMFVPCEGELHSLHGLLARIGWRAKEKYGGHIQRFTLKNLRELVIELGFGITRARWSAHLFNQIADVAYFTAISIVGKNPPTSVEGYLESANGNLMPRIIGAIKRGVAGLSFYESKHLAGVPASGVHIAGVKRSVA